MNHVGLFEGSGIPSLCAQAAGMTTVAVAESDPWCLYALERLYPNAKLFKDVHDVSAESLRDLGTIHCLSGGFPCQDLSTAGRGAGIEGSRSGLWREMFRIVRQVRPAWLVIENVPALRNRGSDRVIAPLERIGYTCWPLVVGAWAVGAPHKRDRVWIVGRRMDNAGCNAGTTKERSGAKGQRKGLHQKRPNPNGTSEGMADAPLRGQRTDRTAQRHAGHADQCGEDVADAAIVGQREQDHETGPESRQRARQGVGGGSGEVRWPARPGEPQHAWEAPRLIEFGLGRPASGLAGRVRSRANKALLRVCGNGWCYPVAQMIFQWIAEQE